MPAEVDFGRFWADSGPPFGPIFGSFRYFLGGRNFDAFLIEFRPPIWGGRRHGRDLRKLIPSLQTPKNTEGNRHPLHHALHPEGVRRIQWASPSAAGPPLPSAACWLAGLLVCWPWGHSKFCTVPMLFSQKMLKKTRRNAGLFSVSFLRAF